MTPLDPALLGRLAEVVGPAHVLVDPEVTASYATDWTGRFAGRTPAVVRPGSTGEVAGVVAACREAGVALVPQGGNTGLVGGGVPLHGEVVLATSRLAALEPVDAAAGQVTAGAGVTVAALQEAAADAGWAYGVDLASRESCTVGGTVATNAGGLRVLRHGDTRAQVLGVEAVLGTGAVVSHLGGLVKDNTGYALPALLCGSEGTLGVLTRVRLRLVPAPANRVVALVGFGDVADAVAAATALRRSLPLLEAVEILCAPEMDLVSRVFSLPAPLERPHAAYLVVEVAGPTDPTGDLASALDGVAGVGDAAVANDEARRAALWRYREDLPPAVNTLGPPHKLDVTLPHAELPGFLVRVRELVARAAPGSRTWLWGHVGDGNVHVNVTGVTPGDERPDAAVLEAVAAAGGSISAEHGIGTAKVPWLHLNRSDAEITAFRAIKRALDPDGVLNPHVLLPAP